VRGPPLGDPRMRWFALALGLLLVPLSGRTAAPNALTIGFGASFSSLVARVTLHCEIVTGALRKGLHWKGRADQYTFAPGVTAGP
jgi:hypothetical protein